VSLTHIVELYRLVGKPSVSSGRFSGEVKFDLGLELINSVRANGGARLDDISVDGEDVHEGDGLPETGAIIAFEVLLPASSSATFRYNLSELINKAPQISRGDMPDEFYLISEDYYTGDAEVPEKVRALRVICKLIVALKKLAHYHDKKAEHGHLSLVFVQPDNDGSGSPVVIETSVDESLLQYAKELDPTLVVELATIGPGEDPHYSARLGVFGVTLSNFITRRPHDVTAFSYLVQHWSEFVGAYQNDLGTYLSGFAFHKAKKEVAEAEFDIASQLAKVISEISGKLLSIPISLAAVAAIPKAGGILQSTVIVIGLLVAAMIVAGIIENQQRQFRRVKHAKNVVLGAIQGRKNDYPEDLRDSVDDMITELDKNEKALGRLLLLFKVISWVPVWIALLVHVFIYSDTAKNLILLVFNL
jgi:hypothetical protein